jgi:hypothetical protein
MDAPPTAAGRITPASEQKPLEQILQATWGTALGILLVLCVLLVIRRFRGFLQEPLGDAGLITVGVIAAAVVSTLRLLERHLRSRREIRALPWARCLLPSLGLLLLGISLSLPGATLVALVTFWAILLTTEAAWWYVELRPLGRRPIVTERTSHSGSADGDGSDDADQGTHASVEETLGHEPPTEENEQVMFPANTTQQMTRMRGEDGTELISGFVRDEFRVGERLRNVHLAFCPPLEARPKLNAYQLDGPSISIKAAQVETYGARLDLRLVSKPERAETVVVRFEVSAPAPSSDEHPKES